MKANELMIGDWVHIDSRSRVPAHNDKVRKIFEKYCDTDNSFIGFEYVEPIPLTEEILKANGWEIMGESIGLIRCLYRISVDERIRIYLHSPYMLQYIDDKIYEGYEQREWSIGNIRFVHELQHALRLFGLNELADNFKLQ